MEKVYVVAPDHYGVEAMWLQEGYEIVRDSDLADIICFTGGEDINPALYGAEPHPNTYFNQRRDDMEVPYYKKHEGLEKLKVGICRGAQLLCAMNGGILYQDVNNHGRSHAVLYTDEEGNKTEAWTTSLHHQMMKPHVDSRAEDWAVAAVATYRDLHLAKTRAINYNEGYDREMVYFPKTASFAFQGHPEFGDARCTQLFHVGVRRALSRREASFKWEQSQKARHNKMKAGTAALGSAPVALVMDDFGDPFNAFNDGDVE